jgi:phosphate transport system substrate-binding protein
MSRFNRPHAHRRTRRSLLGAGLGVALAACARVETPKVTPVPVRVRIGADSAALPLMRALAQAHQSKNPSWLFTFDSGNTAYVSGLITGGGVDLVAVAEQPAERVGWLADLAIDGVAVIVNAANPINGLSLADVREIFAGFRNEWSYFGAQESGSIQVVVREGGEGSKTLFERQVMGDVAATSSAVVLPSPETVLAYVALNPGAVAYVPSGRVTAAPQPSIKMLSLEQQPLNSATLASGAYPLNRTLSLLARVEPQGKLREFAAWVYSEEARAIVQALGYGLAAR